MRVVAVVLLLVLAGCGRGADDGAKPAAGSANTTTTNDSTESAILAGKPAPEALSRFRCAKGEKDDWSASGYLANDGKTKATFQVTVLVDEPDGGAGEARTEQVAGVAPNSSVKFDIAKIPAPEKDGMCRVQVLATS